MKFLSGQRESSHVGESITTNRQQKKTDNKYVQIDLCFGDTVPCVVLDVTGPRHWHQGRPGRTEGDFKLWGQSIGTYTWQYSQQDLIESGIGGSKASRRRLWQRRKRKQHQPTHLAFITECLDPFFSFPFSLLASVCCSFCAFLHKQDCDCNNAR